MGTPDAPEPNLPNAPQANPPAIVRADIQLQPSQKAEMVVGRYKSVDANKWSEDEMNVRVKDISDKMQKNIATVQDVLEYQALVHRTQAARTFREVNFDVETLKADHVKYKEVVLSNMKVTSYELLQNAIERYMEMVRQYEFEKQECIKKGIPIDANEDAIVQAHLQEFVKVCQARLRVQTQLQQSSGSANGAKQIDEANAAMFDVLKSQDPRGLVLRWLKGADPTGKTPEGVVAAHIASLNLLQKQYMAAFEQAKKDKGGTVELNNKVKEWNAILKVTPGLQQFWQNGKLLLPVGKDDVEGMRQLFPANVPFDEYVHATDTLEATLRARTIESANDTFKRTGGEIVGRLAQANATTYQWQLDRARLAAWRHANQEYELSTAKKPEAPSTENLEPIELFLQQQKTHAYGTVQKHIDIVESKVLNVGVLEMTEDAWNKDARVILSQYVDVLTDLETCFIPEFHEQWPGVLDNARQLLNKPSQMTKEYLMGAIPDLIDWPREKDGSLKAHLDEADKARIKENMASVRTVIAQFKAKPEMQNLKSSLKTVQLLTSDPRYHASQLIGVGRVDTSTVQGRLPTDIAAIDQLCNGQPGSPTRAQVLQAAFNQLDADFKSYSKEYKTLLDGTHKVVGIHMDWQKALHQAGGRQLEYMKWILIALGVGYTGLRTRKFFKARAERAKLAKERKDREAELSTLRTNNVANAARIQELEAALSAKNDEITAKDVEIEQLKKDLGDEEGQPADLEPKPEDNLGAGI